MGANLERKLRAFVEMQNRLIAPGQKLYDSKTLPPEMWTQMLSGQAPVMQGLMDAYLEQGKAMFDKEQAQMQLPATLFPGVPGFPPKR